MEPPAASMPKMSYTDRSKHNEVTKRSLSLGPTRNVLLTQSIRFTTAWWWTITPLGRPVEPEVWIIYAISSDLTEVNKSHVGNGLRYQRVQRRFLHLSGSVSSLEPSSELAFWRITSQRY